MTYHHTIFYPKERTLLDEVTTKRSTEGVLKTLPAALLVPHATYSMIGEVLHQTFASAASLKPDLVVFLGPLHQPVLEADKPSFLFAPKEPLIEQASKTYPIDNLLLSELIKHYPISRASSYYEEEPAFELTLPFIDSYLNPRAILPLIGRIDRAAQRATLSTILNRIVDLQKSVVFVISANASGLLPFNEANQEAHYFIDDLNAEKDALEARSSCNWGALEAINKSGLIPGAWEITSQSLKGTEYPRLDDAQSEAGLMTWHIGAYKGV